MWLSGQLNCPVDEPVTDYELYGVEGITEDGNDTNSRTIYDEQPSQIISLQLMDRLEAEIPFDSTPFNYGIDNFQKARDTINNELELLQ